MGMPRVNRAGGGWTRTITMDRRTQKVVNGLVQDIDYKFSFRGTIQPLSPNKIMLKPEGQRSWEWLQVHVFGGWTVDTNDRVVYNGAVYKIMADNDYSQHGFCEYHLVKDYQ